MTLVASQIGQKPTGQKQIGWTRAALAARVVRYAELKPCYNAFIDCRTPGSSAKENFTIIGPGVSENPAQFVHIAEPHGYNIGGARQPPGCVNSQHSHDTAEVFLAHTGHWRFDLGEHGTDAQVELHPGDVISLPIRTFRGFTNIGDGPGFLWAVLGQDNPGRVMWAPQVFEMARNYGLVLLENGALVDTVAGDTVPEGAAVMPPTSRTAADALQRLSPAAAQALVARNVAGSGTVPVIGAGGPLDWDHGFTLDRIDITAGMAFDLRGDGRTQVLFVHSGAASIELDDGALELGAGDTLSLPDVTHARLHSDAGATLFTVTAHA